MKKVSSIEFEGYMRDVGIPESEIQDIRMREEIYKKSLTADDNVKSSIMSMATFRKNKSGLPVNIWVDDGMAYKADGHSKRIKFQTDIGDRPVTFNFASMTISNSPEVTGKHELSAKEIKQLEDFVIRNKDALEQLSDMEIDFEDFLQVVRS